jgi:GGDEF domain-containing protein
MSIFVFKDLVVFGLNLRLLIVGLSFLTLLVNLGVYIYSNRLFYNRLQLVKASINISGHKILAYLNQRAKLLYFTDAFTAILNIEKNQTDVFEELISSIFVDSQDMNFRPFLHYLKTPEERDYRVVLNLYNGNSLKLDLMKRKVIQNGRLLGYVLLNQSTTAVQEASSLSFNHYHYLNFMDEAICYFDLKSRRYILNQEMVKLIGVQDEQISENSFKSAVVSEDLPILEKREITENNQKLFYRLQTTQGKIWFEENNIYYDDQVYVLIRRTDFFRFKGSYRNRQMLLETIKLVYERNNWLSLFAMDISAFSKIVDSIGSDAAEVLLNSYFRSLMEEFHLDNLKLYRLGESLFAFIIDNQEKCQKLIDSLNNQEHFLRKTIEFNNKKFNFNNKLGIITSDAASNPRADAILNGAIEALNYALDDKYNQPYCLYAPKQDPDFNFNEFGIDLSDDFLDDILKTKE